VVGFCYGVLWAGPEPSVSALRPRHRARGGAQSPKNVKKWHRGKTGIGIKMERKASQDTCFSGIRATGAQPGEQYIRSYGRR